MSHLIYFGATGFWGCALAEAVGAVGQASRSEALESWLRNHGDEKSTHRALTEGDYWSKLAVIPTAFLGGIIGSQYGLQWPWLLSGTTGLMALLGHLVVAARGARTTRQLRQG